MAVEEFERLTRALDALDKEGKAAHETLRKLEVGRDHESLLNQIKTIKELTAAYRSLYQERAKLSAIKSAPAGVANTEPMPPTGGIGNNDIISSRKWNAGWESISKAAASQLKEEMGQEAAMFRGRRKVADHLLQQEEAARKRSVTAANKKAEADEKAAQAAAERAAFEKAITKNPKYREAIRQAEAAGYSISNLSNIHNRGTGVDRLNWSRYDEDAGVDRSLTQFVSTSGKVTPGVTGQYRSFTQGVLRDIGELTKWSIAMAAIYGPIQKLGDMIAATIANESKLADVSVVLNTSLIDQGDAFDVAADAAKAAGEEVTGVIDAYAQAYRATGQYTSILERQEKSVKLLGDALTLSKLSTLDQGAAIDTLTAALLQNNSGLDEGAELLNKWVRVSQIAAVDIEALAVGTAVLGDAAEAAGLDIDHLNGLVAVLAKTSISGSKEAANTAKALIGAYQSNEAEKTLSRYGISLRNTKGEVREFLDIYSQLADLWEKGLLSEAAVSEISIALGGGGVRRAKDVPILMKNLKELNSIAGESAGVTGKDTLAQEALAKKLDTVQTASTRLSNSFESLAMTLGDEGGLLDVAKTLANILSTLVEGMDKLFSLLGKSGPALAVFTAAAVPLISKGAMGREAAIYSLADAAAMRAGRSYKPLGGQFSQLDSWNQMVRMENARGKAEKFYGALYNPNMLTGSLYGAAAVGLAAGQNFAQGNNVEGAGNIAGGVIGAGIGTLIAPGVGTAIGATIGSAIGEAFVKTTLTYEKDLAEMFRDAAADGATSGGKEPTREEQLLEDIYAPDRGGTGIKGVDKLAYSFAIWGATQMLNYGTTGIGIPGVARIGIDSGKERGGAFWRGEDTWKVNQTALLFASEEEKARFEAMRNYNLLKEGKSPTDFGTMTDAQRALDKQRTEQETKRLEAMADVARREQLARTSSGKITPSDYKNISEDLTGYAATAIQWNDAFGDTFIALSDDIDNTTEAYQAFLDMTIYGSKEQRDYISTLVAEMNALEEVYKNWDVLSAAGDTTYSVMGKEIDFAKEGGREGVSRAIEDLGLQVSTVALSGYNQAKQNKYQLPQIVGDITQPIRKKDYDWIYKEGMKMQEEYLKSQGYTADMIEQFAENVEDYAQKVKEGGREFYIVTEGLAQQFYSAAEKRGAEEGAITTQQGIGIMGLGATSAQYQQALSQYPALQAKLEAMGYESVETESIVKLSDKDYFSDRKDFKLIQILLEKILDVNQKELDGIYNLPEGAGIFVPLEAALLRPEGPVGGETVPFEGTIPGKMSTTEVMERSLQLKQDYEKVVRPGLRGSGDVELVPKKLEDVSKFLADSIKEGPMEWNSRRLQSEYGGSEGKDGAYRSPSELQKAPESATVLDSVREWLSGIFSGGQEPKGAIGSMGEMQQTVPEVSNKLDITIDSHTQLMVDGRVLADIVKTYLAAELLKSQQSQSTITRRYVI